MATETVKRCDVFNTYTAKWYRVVLLEMKEDGSVKQELVSKNVDMCPRAVERCKKFIEKGTTPPGKKDE